MDGESDLLERTAARIFSGHTQPAQLAEAERGEWPADAWQAVEAAGLTRALVPEAAGGFGIDTAEALAILRVAGTHALPLPLAETMLAAWLLAMAGLEIPDGAMTIAPGATQATRWRCGATAMAAACPALRGAYPGAAMSAAVAAVADARRRADAGAGAGRQLGDNTRLQPGEASRATRCVR